MRALKLMFRGALLGGLVAIILAAVAVAFDPHSSPGPILPLFAAVGGIAGLIYWYLRYS